MLSNALGNMLVSILTKEISGNSKEIFEQLFTDGKNDSVVFKNKVERIPLETTKLLFVGVNNSQSEQVH